MTSLRVDTSGLTRAPEPPARAASARAFAESTGGALLEAVPDFAAALRRFRVEGTDDGCLLVEGLPHDTGLPPTGESAAKASGWSEAWLSAAGLALGQPLAFGAIKKGALFHDNFPRPDKVGVVASGNPETDLGLHTELHYHSVPPAWLLLFCLVPDRHGEAATGVASWRRAAKKADLELVRDLRRPEFRVSTDLAFRRLGSPETLAEPVPVLSGHPDDEHLHYDAELTVGTTPRATAALARLDTLLREHLVEFRLRAGDLLVIDNRRTSHARTRFRAYFDGRDRWLQRTYVVDPDSLTSDERATWTTNRLP